MQHSLASLQAHAKKVSSPEPALLAALRKETGTLSGAQMLSSSLQGRILALFSQLLHPSSILEIGTYTGYSALCLSEGLTQAGILHTIDSQHTHTHMVQRYLAKAGKLQQVHCHIGKALDILPQIKGPFDLVFIDADKKNYLQYYELVIPNLRLGGLVIADNVLWKGNVLDKESMATDARAQAMANFAYRLQVDKRVQQVCLLVCDGLLVARKC